MTIISSAFCIRAFTKSGRGHKEHRCVSARAAFVTRRRRRLRLGCRSYRRTNPEKTSRLKSRARRRRKEIRRRAKETCLAREDRRRDDLMRVSGDRLSAGPISIDPARQEVLVNGKPV